MTPDTGIELPARSAPWLLATSGVLAAFVLAMLWIGGARLGIAHVFAVTGGMLVVMAAGTVVLTLAGLHGVPAELPVTFLVGTTATSAALLSLVLVTGVTAGAAFVGWAGGVAVALAAVARKVSWRGRPGDGVDTAVLAALAVLVGFWCRHAAGALPALRATGRLPVWTDYYIHGALVAQFGDRLAAGRGSLSLADNAPGLYHYGSYMPAAALAGVVDLPGLGLATSVWLPLGMLMAAIGSYALAAALADRRAGVIAIAGLGLLPDAASYGFANGFFGFHWVMFTVPGSGYALGSAAAVLVLVAEWWRRRALAALVLGLALTALTFQLRAHVFLLLAPALALTLACDTGWARRHGRALAWAGIGAGTVVLALLLVILPLRTFWLERSAVLGFLNFVHQHSHPTAYPDLYRWLVATFGQPAAVLLGTALLIPVALGALVVVYPAALAAWVWRAGWQTVDLFPPLLLAVFAAVALFAPAAPHGDATEYQHRPFVLLYQIVAVWTAAYLARLIFAGSKAARPISVVAALAGVVALSILLGWTTGSDPARPRVAWGRGFFGVASTPGLVEAAAYVRTAARPGDTVAVAPLDRKATLIDPAIEFASLTGVPAYLARARHHTRRGGADREIAVERLARMGEVEGLADPAAVSARLRSMGVTWYVRLGAEGPRFDPSRGRAAFVARHAAVYRLGAGELAN